MITIRRHLDKKGHIHIVNLEGLEENVDNYKDQYNVYTFYFINMKGFQRKLYLCNQNYSKINSYSSYYLEKESPNQKDQVIPFNYI